LHYYEEIDIYDDRSTFINLHKYLNYCKNFVKPMAHPFDEIRRNIKSEIDA